MISERIARRYVKALFGLAAETGQVEAVGALLGSLQNIYREHTTLRNALADPRLAPDRKQALLLRLTGPGTPPVLARFIELLVEKRRLPVLQMAGSIFARLRDEAAGIRQATVLSALPLGEAQQQRLQAALSELLGLQVVLTARVEPSVVGGLQVQVDDLLIDGSLRGRLQGLRQQFRRTEARAAG
jgi:F-type H+-transporting ATPase subunit delta